MAGVKLQEPFQREQCESLRGDAVLCLSHKEEGHSKISSFSLNMRAFVIPPSQSPLQGELHWGRDITEGAGQDRLGTQ